MQQELLSKHKYQVQNNMSTYKFTTGGYNYTTASSNIAPRQAVSYQPSIITTKPAVRPSMRQQTPPPPSSIITTKPAVRPSMRQQTPPPSNIYSRKEIPTPPQNEKFYDVEIYEQLDRFAATFADSNSQDIIMKALNEITLPKTTKFKQSFKKVIQMSFNKQSHFRQQNDPKTFEKSIEEILNSQKMCDTFVYAKSSILKDVAKLWNDRKAIEDFTNKFKIENKAYLTSYLSSTGLSILQKLEKREDSNSRTNISSVNKSSSSTATYIQRDIGDELDKILNGTYNKQTSKFKYYASKVNEALDKFNQNFNDKLASQRRDVRPNTSRNQDSENLKLSLMRQAEVKDKMIRKILETRETSSIEEKKLRNTYEKQNLISLLEEIVKIQDEKYKKLLQSKNSPTKPPAYEFQTKAPIKTGSLRDSNAHQKSKSIEADIAIKEKQLESINYQIQKTGDDYRSLQGKFIRIQRQVADIESKLQSKQKQSSALEAMTNTRNELRASIDKLLVEKAEAQRNKTELDKNVSELKVQNEKLTQQRNLLEGQIKNLETRVSVRQPILSAPSMTQVNNKLKTLEQKNRDLEKRLSDSQQSERKWKAEADRVDNLNDKEMQIAKLELELKEAKDKLQSASNNRGSINELQSLKEQIAVKDRQIRKYELQIIPSNQKEIKSLKEQIAQYSHFQKEIFEQNQRLNAQLLETSEKMNKAEDQANSKSKQLYQEEKKRKEIENEYNNTLNKFRLAEKQLRQLKESKKVEAQKKPIETIRVGVGAVSTVDRMKYTKQIEALKKDLADQQKQMKQQQSEKQSIRIKLSDLQKKWQQNQKESQLISKKLSEAANQNNRLQKIITDNESLLQNQSREFEKLKQQKGAKDNNKESFEKEKSELIAAIHDRENIIRDREAHLDKCFQDINKCNADISILVGIKEQHEKQKIEREQHVKSLQEEINMRQIDLNFLTDENKNLKNRVTELEKEVKSSNDRAKSDGMRLENEQLRNANKEIAELKSTKTKLEIQKNNLERKVTELNNLYTRNNTPSYREDILRKDLEKSRADLRKIEDQRRDLSTKNDKQAQGLRTQLQQLESSRVKKDADFQKLTIQLKQYEQNFTKKDSEIQRLTSQLQSLESINKKMKEDLGKAQGTSRLPINSRDTMRLTQLQNKTKDLEKKIKQKDEEIADLNANIQSMEGMNADYVNQIQNLQKEIENMKSEQNKSRIQTPSRPLVDNQRTADQLKQALSKNQSQARTIQDLQKEIKKITTEYQSLKAKAQSQSGQNGQIQRQLKAKTLQVQVLSNQKAKLEGELKLYKQDLTKSKQRIDTQLKQINDKNDQITKLRDQIRKTQQAKSKPLVMTSAIGGNRGDNTSEYKRKIEELQSQLKLKDQKIASLVSIPAPPASEGSICINCFFQGKVIDRDLESKKFLIETLSAHINRRILRTEMIYSFDPQNKVNFHKYFDNKELLVLIVKMRNGSLIAAYSESGFIPKVASAKDGLIMSLSNKQVFKLAEVNRRAITYDDFYLIFGNSEIRIKSQDTLLFSNFAISNGYYNARGKKVDLLMGGGPNERELHMQHYEIYQLVPQNE